MSTIDTCSLCPRLCRTACPVATGASWEAAVPSQIAGVVLAYQQGRLERSVAEQAVTACVDCGACQNLCHLHQPLPMALSGLRKEWGLVTAPTPLLPILGAGTWVAIETGRSWASALSERLGESVASWRTSDGLGANSLEHKKIGVHLEKVAEMATGRTLVTAHGGVLAVLKAAGVSARHLSEVLEEPVVLASCCGGAGPLACCGAAGPLREHHRDAADRMAHHWVLRGGTTAPSDTRCATHLREAGVSDVHDPVSRLLGGEA